MKNEYKEKYIELIDYLDKKQYKYFEKVNVKVDDKEFCIYKFLINKKILNNAYELACKKEKYTVDYDQAGIIRSEEIKIINQMKGILAEIGVQLLLEKVMNQSGVKRWDLERESFDYSTNEYDVKFFKGNREFYCESRSSTSYKTTLEQFISKYHIIGPYTSSIKKNEKDNDFYFRPVYQYQNINRGNIITRNKNFFKDIYSGELKLYFVSGATLQQMKSCFSELSTNNQNSTQYRQIRIIKVGDMEKFINNIKNAN